MSSLGRVEEFVIGQKNWSTYTARLEQYFKANNIEEDKKVAIVLTVFGDETYELITDLFSPTEPDTKTYKDIVQKHLEPEPSEIADRYKFRQKKTTSRKISCAVFGGT